MRLLIVLFSMILMSCSSISSVPSTAKPSDEISEPKVSVLPCFKWTIYKNTVGKIIKAIPPVDAPDNFKVVVPNGLKYEFVAQYPNGMQDRQFTVFPPNTVNISVGDLFLWIPASDEVRKLHPNDDRHVPIITDKLCSKKYIIDISRPAKEIPGIN